MLKKLSLLFIFLFFTACGYEAMHSKKNKTNYNFSIKKLNFVGDRDINLKIKQRLKNYALKKQDKDIILNINSISQKIILAKNTAGDPTSFNNTITVNVKILTQSNTQSNLTFKETFNYNNNSNKFNLKRYEREIKINLAETIVDKLIFELSNVQ